MESLFFLVFNAIFLISCFRFCNGTDTFTTSESVSDGKTLVSRDGNFELGFFSPGRSRGRYLGIWYKNIPVRTVVWVANRRNPINDSSSLLLLNIKGDLVLLSRTKGVVWSTNSTKVARNPVVQLLDSGNLVIRDGKSENFLWQSFDYPTDTILPGMKIGWDLRNGLNRHFSAWKSLDDPSPGDYTSGMELYNYPDIVSRQGAKKIGSAGPWNGLGFSGSPMLRLSPGFRFEFVWNTEEVYFRFYLSKQSSFIRYVLEQANYKSQGYRWNEGSKTWVLSTYPPIDVCDNYGLCGAYGSCDSTQVVPCQCLEGFKPNASHNWDSINWSNGCVRDKPLDCEKGDTFIKFARLKLPDTEHSWVDKSIDLKECRAKCLQNCSCMAYTNTDIRGEGSGCAIWFGNLFDIKQFQGGQDLYIRMSTSQEVREFIHEEPKGNVKMKISVPIIISTVIFIVMLLCCCYICRSRRSPKSIRGENENHVITDRSNSRQKEDMELGYFNLAMLAKATKDFSSDNKLGQGGFGHVYKGTMEDGQEIAVKRLSIGSRQGSDEFKNEVELIAKLQHRNLVKLLGCCVQGEERMLVYEFMPNKSLNSFIFDRTKHTLLDWPKRFHIINGVSRGLVYLHQDSRLRIIHRDLKASNVLLDSDMNPKISDFGLAKTFGGDQTEGKTNRVVGTYGYMAPEYAIDGQFSVKSDVFSFGILVLEIVSGKKNKGFYHPNHDLNLIGHAWELWKYGKPFELIDSVLQETCSVSEVVRCIQIALLCVQVHPEDRPNMSSVVFMLGSESALVEPKEPVFLTDKKSSEIYTFLTTKIKSSSTNDVSISILDGR